MTTNTAVGTAPMAKTQRNVMVPDDLHRLLKAHEKRTGVAFTRVVIAALLQYLFTRPDGPDPYWMEHAIALEDGFPIIEVPMDRQSCVTADLNRMQRLMEEEGTQDDEPATSVTYQDVSIRLKREFKEWREMLKRPEEDAIDKIIESWSKNS